MNKIFTAEFWVNAAKRALYTFAETALAMLTVGQAFTEVQWLHILSVSAVATIISVLKSIIVGMPEMSTESAQKDARSDFRSGDE